MDVFLCVITRTCFTSTFVAAIGPTASALAEGTGGGDELEPSASKASSSLACRRSGADKMIDFMRTLVSIVEMSSRR